MDFELGKLSVAILENLVSSITGGNFVDGLRESFVKKENIAKALKTTEERFIKESDDKELAKAIILDLPIKDTPTLQTAFRKYYERPSNPDLPLALSEIIAADYPTFSKNRVDNASNLFVSILTEELALTDEKFMGKIKILTDLRVQQTQQITNRVAEALDRLILLANPKNSMSEGNIEEALNNIQALLLQLQNTNSKNDKTVFPKSYIFGEINTIDTVSELCFVLMPFGPSWSRKLFDSHIVKACKNQNLKALRADDIYSARGIMQDVWAYINQARLIIADLTTRNPNVFYEVGIAHTLGKEVILITQTMDDVPFDLRAIRCIVYSLELDGPKALERDLSNTISQIIATTTSKYTE